MICRMIWERTKRKTYARSERELQVIRPEGVVLDADVDGFVEEIFVAVEVLGYAEPEAEELCKCQYGPPARNTKRLLVVVKLRLTGVEQII